RDKLVTGVQTCALPIWLAEALETMRLDPNSAFSYGVLGASYLGLNRFAEAKAVREKQVALKLDNMGDHRDLYVMAFLEGETSGKIGRASCRERVYGSIG